MPRSAGSLPSGSSSASGTRVSLRPVDVHQLDRHLVLGIGVTEVDQAQDGEADVDPIRLNGCGAGQQGQTGTRYEKLSPADLREVAQQELGIHGPRSYVATGPSANRPQPVRWSQLQQVA